MSSDTSNEVAIKRVKTILAKHRSLPPPELIRKMVKAGTADSEARRVTWHLLDRGEIVVDQQMHLTLHSKQEGNNNPNVSQ